LRAHGNCRWFRRAWHGGVVSAVFVVSSLVLYMVVFHRPALVGNTPKTG